MFSNTALLALPIVSADMGYEEREVVVGSKYDSILEGHTRWGRSSLGLSINKVEQYIIIGWNGERSGLLQPAALCVALHRSLGC